MFCEEPTTQSLKSDRLAEWIESEWTPRHPDYITLWIPSECLHLDALAKFNPALELQAGVRFIGREPIDCPILAAVHQYNYEGILNFCSGAYVYRFAGESEQLEVLVAGAYYSDHSYERVAVASIPQEFLPAWTVFSNECVRLAQAELPTNKVVIIGGRSDSFVPTVDWSDVILPEKLKTDILDDTQSFFTKGVDIYRRLGLKPFRKLLLAGVPGTGKTMICNALAKWALEHNYLVIYVSSAVRYRGDDYGSAFSKIQQALAVAAHSRLPALILLEELDAYLHKEEKAIVLNVLDGSEALINDKGTLLISTTNYPEAIDERILKRPGRLDRIFIIPEAGNIDDAEKVLRRYLGNLWLDEHRAIVPKLVGYPGAFIREVAIFALTQLAYDDRTELPFELLERSFHNLKEQIDVRDDFLSKRNPTVGFNGKRSRAHITRHR